MQTISWIFLATALATNTKPTNINGISEVADGINHAVPTQKELQTSISWLTRTELIIKNGKNYELTSKGKSEYETASNKTETLMNIWKNLELKFSNYVSNHYDGN
jgi:predicted transcriptional regulator